MVAAVPETPYQAPFQSSSTPVMNRRRFLCWNSVGVITSRDEDTHYAVEIELHDTSKHKNSRFTDHYNFKVAALCEKGAFFASEALSASGLVLPILLFPIASFMFSFI